MKKILLLIFILTIYSLAYGIEVQVGYPKACASYETIKVYGKVETTQNITILAPISGIIRVNSNFSTVKSGQLIAQIYPPRLSRQIEYAKANVKAAYNNLQSTIKLKNTHIATSQELEKAKMLYYQAKNNLEQLNAQSERSKIYAPFAGSLEFLVPNKSSAALNQPIATLTGNSNLWIKAYVAPDSIDKLKIGQTIYYYLNNSKYIGTIAQLSPSTDSSGLVPIFINTNNKALIAGQWVSLEIPISKSHGFCIPKSAISTKGSKAYIYVVTDGVAHKKQIKLINVSNNTAYISAYITNNEPIVTNGVERLKNNIKVKIIK
ncbi:putative Co/Zn/Cd efflux system membrane fusion protein [Desulfurella amilsii]|uniref:Putative Co/Zn/Cd efflux system membrane fusion protein n=1 Tax=Desulfurella amilsii TaxID=1562698 RepID=A0A1X4XU87_9BACT|nr:efflux RND transporter periplasmic adaptor subunit [Desulfurella amilsii]OSS41089.1 putative Co/Zn/Cd efflux system membrane fusion protein [Desulfurella amilsii]